MVFPTTVEVRSITVSVVKARPVECELLASDNGRNFRPVSKFETGWQSSTASYSSITVGFEPARGKVFRLLLSGGDAQNYVPDKVSFSLSGGQRVTYWELKACHQVVQEHGGAMHMYAQPAVAAPAGDRRGVIPKAGVVDLTRHANAEGLVEWDVPAGKWTILRIGYTPTGKLNGAATAEGHGLDCDKLTRAGVETHFHQGMMAKLLADVKPFAGKTLKAFHDDSWEAGIQNWSATFRDDFRKRRGYDPLPYLPVMAGGRVVESRDVSERFLWDLRRTLADLIRDEYWGRLKELCHEHGMKFSVESAGRRQFLYDPIELLAQGDLPMGEFWLGEEWARPDCKLAASAAHISGGNIAGAESYTSMRVYYPVAGMWQDSPYSIKAKGDHVFCTGINRFVFHRFVSQPSTVRGPNMTWPGIGLNFGRTETWWKPGAAWIRYLTRCQFLLQHGRFVGDVCVLTGEGAPNVAVRRSRYGPSRPEGQDASTFTEASLSRTGGLHPEVPWGYDFDACSPSTLARMRVVDGRLTLPSGMSYAALVLPPCERMTPALVGRIAALVEAGATVVGPKPKASPSLADHANADREVRRLADQVWGDCDGRIRTQHVYGKGRVVWGVPLEEILSAAGVPPDFRIGGARSDTYVDYIHRSDGKTDIYFISNQKERLEEVECSFRVTGRKPQLWDPDSGEVRDVAVYYEARGRTVIPLRLDPAGSVFVVFRDPVKKDPIIDIQRDGRTVWPDLTAWRPGTYALRRASGRSNSIKIGPLPKPLPITGPWRLQFPPDWGAPESVALEKLISWTEHADDGVRHFSGTATYTADIDIPAAWLAPGNILHLDLHHRRFRGGARRGHPAPAARPDREHAAARFRRRGFRRRVPGRGGTRPRLRRRLGLRYGHERRDDGCGRICRGSGNCRGCAVLAPENGCAAGAGAKRNRAADREAERGVGELI